MQEEQARYKYRVVWNGQKGSYEVHAIRPRIFSWLAITPDSARWFELLQQSPSFHFHGQHGRFTARTEKRARRRLLDRLPAYAGQAQKEVHRADSLGDHCAP